MLTRRDVWAAIALHHALASEDPELQGLDDCVKGALGVAFRMEQMALILEAAEQELEDE